MLRKIIRYYKEVKQRFVTVKWGRSWSVEASYLQELIADRKKRPERGLYDSMFQYKAQTFRSPLAERILLQVMAVVSLAFVVIKGLLMRVNPEQKCDVAYFYSLSIFSEAQKAGRSFGFVAGDALKLTFSDLRWILKRLLQTGFNFAILSATAFRIAQIRFALEKYAVSEIWSNMEYSPACGLVYEYCEKNNLKLKNFMHGEKVLTLRDTFTRFHELYVWDIHYKHIFEILHCDAKIVVDNPWLMQQPKENVTKSRKVCYFLTGIESAEEKLRLNENLEKLLALDFEIYYKPHPRNTTAYFFNERFREFSGFQDNNIAALYQFDYIIAQSSTILFQCLSNQQDILIDDLTGKASKLKELADRKFILFSKDRGVKFLSDYCAA